MTPRIIAALVIFLVVAAFSKQAVADEAHFVMNFDLITKTPDGSVEGNIQLQGVRLLSGKSFRGDDLSEFDYFFTVQEVEDGKGKLTIEFYLYETRRKKSDPISEIIAEVDFTLGIPVRFEGTSDEFGIDLAFSIDDAGE